MKIKNIYLSEWEDILLQNEEVTRRRKRKLRSREKSSEGASQEDNKENTSSRVVEKTPKSRLE